MADDTDDDTFYDCVECSGERGRPRRSDGSATCKFDGCKRSYAKKRKLEAVAADAPRSAQLAPTGATAAPTVCYKIKHVLGVAMCLPSDMSGYERRNGKKAAADQLSYLVCGGFGEDAQDSMINDRLQNIVDLVEN